LNSSNGLKGCVASPATVELSPPPGITSSGKPEPTSSQWMRTWPLSSFIRRRGEALHPERQPLAILDQIRHTIGEYNFADQYQQMPSPQGGGMVKAIWFRSYAANERPEKFDHIVQGWDTANKAFELSDFSACASWGIKGKDLYPTGAC
jgi:hypothetical protein